MCALCAMTAVVPPPGQPQPVVSPPVVPPQKFIPLARKATSYVLLLLGRGSPMRKQAQHGEYMHDAG